MGRPRDIESSISSASSSSTIPQKKADEIRFNAVPKGGAEEKVAFMAHNSTGTVTSFQMTIIYVVTLLLFLGAAGALAFGFSQGTKEMTENIPFQPTTTTTTTTPEEEYRRRFLV